MSVAARAPEARVDWAVVARPRRGEEACGDAGVVRELPGGVLVAGVDGLGHGVEAAAATARALEVVAGARDGDVLALMDRCHRHLAGSRGAAISLAWLDLGAATMTWLAIGDVDGRLLGGGRERALRLPGGLAGEGDPTLAPETIAIEHGDVLVLASDGIDRSFADDLDLGGAPEAIAGRLLSGSWDGTDDALAVVVRLLAGPPAPGAP